MATPLCEFHTIPDGAARGIDLGEQRYIVVRQANQVFAYRNRCPHLGIPLDWLPDEFMDLDAELLRCATHGALFLPDTGECVSGPCVGQFLIPVNVTRSGDTVVLQD